MTPIDYLMIVLFSVLTLTIVHFFFRNSDKYMKAFFAARGAVRLGINSPSLFIGER